MPKALERKLKREAREKGLSGDRADAYVYGNPTMLAHRKKKAAHKKERGE